MTQKQTTDTDRGQAYTLEGFIGAMVVLMAVLFALQSAVITPSTGGLADRSVQAQIQQETQDALVVAATAEEDEARSLSYMVRHWDETGGFEGADDSTYDMSEDYFKDEFKLGAILEGRFGEGWSYNVELHPQNDNEKTHELVYQGNPSSSAVTASYTVTLYSDQNATGSDKRELSVINDDDSTEAAIDDIDDSNGPVYNVVEVRVVVW
ncbi:hypothetical protein HYG81_15410 [Natrinema zhouii]|uniref:Uncharacterized protein n=1 Tax=Natrinema zhouii TaxID=1710539 RepID=A0A7D6CNV6_9EURY|nr:hypothetical protein [Natrinema zhouii]QLK25456.1 hypothetical protein HYG81_15410 [Natrinema zhouii]